MSADEVLEQLADGAFHSGQALADQHGVSRTAIWKQVSSLAAMGIPINRVRGLGYQIPGGMELLDEQRLRRALLPSTRGLVAELRVLRRVDSTNAELQRHAWPPAGRAAICLAEYQRRGRGRHGRDWVSPFGSNIYLSMAWTFSGGAEVLEGLPLAVGVALVDALGQCGAAGLSLKWPNDVQHAGRKLAGILVEMTGDASGPCRVVLGLGVNVAMPADAARDIEQPWIDLAGILDGEPPRRNALVVAVLEQLLPLLATYEQTGFKPWRERWQALDAYRDQEVVLSSGSERRAGVARGVDGHGALLLESATGLVSVHGGELSLRAAL